MTRDAFTPSDVRGAPPSVPVRHWHTALFLGIAGALASFVGSAFALWRPLPLVGAPPTGAFGQHLLAWGNMVVYAITGGNVGGAGAHEYLDLLGDLASTAPETPVAVWSRFGLCVFAAATVGGYLLRIGLTPRSAEQHLSGAQLRTGVDALRVARMEAARMRAGNKTGFMRLHPALDLPRAQWARHVLVTGSVGSGKSQIILPMLEQIIAANHKAIIADLKGEFTAAFPTCVLINPFDARSASAIWDIGRDLASRDDAAVFAASLIPGSDKNPFFSTSAQMLLTGIVWSLQSDFGRQWGWSALAERAALPAADLESLLKTHYPEAAAFLNPQARSSGDVHSTLLTATRLLRSLAQAWGRAATADGKPRRRVSLRAWMRDDYAGRTRQLILGNGPNPQLTSAWVSAMMNVLVPHLVSPELPDDPARALFFVFDELPALGKIALAPLVDRGRSKGCFCILGAQDVMQLKLVYGPELAQAMPSMIANHVVCQLSPGETRDAIAARIGKRRVAVYETTTTTQGGSHRIVEHHDRPILLPSDLTQGLGVQRNTRNRAGFAVRALVMIGGDVLRLDFPGTVLPRRRRAFVPAPWLAPVDVARASEPAAPAATATPTTPANASPAPATARTELLRLADRLDTVRRAEPSHADDPAA